MDSHEYNTIQQFSSSDSFLDEIYQEKEKSFYDLMDDLSYHLKQMDILLADIKKTL